MSKHKANTAGSQNNTLPAYDKIALVLQGGGALGSYQAGVYQGLANAGIEPNWVAGISIGAINAAIIAGNAPNKRVDALKAFWDTVCQPALFPNVLLHFDPILSHFPMARQMMGSLSALRALIEGQSGFFVPRFPLPGVSAEMPDQVSYYDTSMLRSTLERFADFDRINSGEMQVSVGAVNIRTGNFTYFDNQRMRLRPEHFMASGALPSGFPAVEIDGEYYWDGGLVSNTPLVEVLRSSVGQRSLLVFQVDLWSARGDLPKDFMSVAERIKDIQYSSRTRLLTTVMEERQYERRLLKALLEHIPEDVKAKDPWCRRAQELANDRLVNIIHLIYQDNNVQGHYKDYEFSATSMASHWASGLSDTKRTLAHADWLSFPSPEKGFITHDIHRADKFNSSKQ